MRVKLGPCFGVGLFTLDTAIKTTIRGSFLRFTFLKERVGVKEMFLWTKSMNKSSLTFRNLLDALKTEVVKTKV